MKKLETVYNRGFWDGYYLGKTMGEWSNSYGSKASKRKVFIGSGLKYYDKVKVGEFQLEAQTLGLGDEVIITGPTTGLLQLTISEMHLNNAPTDSVKKGDVFSFPVESKIRPSDKLYKIVDA
jgi:putative protease